MTEEVSDFLVVGTGPSAAAAVFSLLPLNKTICVIDAGVAMPSVGFNSVTSQKSMSFLKPYKGDFSDYFIHPKSVENYEQNIVPRPSNFFGGFSRVWGATAHGSEAQFGWPSNIKPSKEDLIAFQKLIRIVKVKPSPFAEESKERFEKFANKEWKVRHSLRALKGSEHEIVDNSFVSAANHLSDINDFWQSSSLITKWVSQGLVNHYGGIFVLNCCQKPDSVVVNTIDLKGDLQQFVGRRLILAAGAIGTAQILVRSGFLARVRIPDTPTAFGGFISRNLVRCAEELDNQISQWWAEDEKDGYIAQIYQPSRLNELRIRTELRIPRRIRSLSLAISERIYPVVMYSPKTSEEYIEVVRNSGETSVKAIQSEEVRRQFGVAIGRFALSLRKSGYWAARKTFKIGDVGQGFHSGSSLPHNLLTSDLGSLPSLKRIHIVDSSVLPHLKPGPITSVTILNSIRIARAIGKLNE